jgi:hypothetical protein
LAEDGKVQEGDGCLRLLGDEEGVLFLFLLPLLEVDPVVGTESTATDSMGAGGTYAFFWFREVGVLDFGAEDKGRSPLFVLVVGGCLFGGACTVFFFGDEEVL